MDGIQRILEKALAEEPLAKPELVTLLSAADEGQKEQLYSTARELRKRYFSDKIFLYGFVYFSTWCRNDCNFCYFRKSNEISRYRKTSEEIFDTCKRLADSGVHLLDLTMGEDVSYHQEQFDSILELVHQLKNETGLPVMISPGVVERPIIDRFAQAGVEWYALYQETHNRALYAELRADQDYDQRMDAKLYARDQGMLIEEGILTGVGESVEDIADSILMMGEIGAKQMRVMSFVPQAGSPMENAGTPDRTMEQKIIAVMRLCYPRVLIPASLDVDGIAGLSGRIDAGASVVTSIIPPSSGFSGVAHESLDVDEGGRTVEEVSHILAGMGLRAASAGDYQSYLNILRGM